MKSFDEWWAKKPITERVQLHKPASDYAEEAWQVAVTACIEELRSAGCICDLLDPRRSRAEFRGAGHYQSVVSVHDYRCPKAVAKRLAASLIDDWPADETATKDTDTEDAEGTPCAGT